MRNDGSTRVRKGRVVYDRVTHTFGPFDVVRILTRLIKDNELTKDDRRIISNIILFDEPLPGENSREKVQPWWEYLLYGILPLPDYLIDLAKWLVGLEIEAVTRFLRDWVANMEGNGGTK